MREKGRDDRVVGMMKESLKRHSHQGMRGEERGERWWMRLKWDTTEKWKESSTMCADYSLGITYRLLPLHVNLHCVGLSHCTYKTSPAHIYIYIDTAMHRCAMMSTDTHICFLIPAGQEYHIYSLNDSCDCPSIAHPPCVCFTEKFFLCYSFSIRLLCLVSSNGQW